MRSGTKGQLGRRVEIRRRSERIGRRQRHRIGCSRRGQRRLRDAVERERRRRRPAATPSAVSSLRQDVENERRRPTLACAVARIRRAGERCGERSVSVEVAARQSEKRLLVSSLCTRSRRSARPAAFADGADARRRGRTFTALSDGADAGGALERESLSIPARATFKGRVCTHGIESAREGTRVCRRWAQACSDCGRTGERPRVVKRVLLLRRHRSADGVIRRERPSAAGRVGTLELAKVTRRRSGCGRELTGRTRKERRRRHPGTILGIQGLVVGAVELKTRVGHAYAVRMAQEWASSGGDEAERRVARRTDPLDPRSVSCGGRPTYKVLLSPSRVAVLVSKHAGAVLSELRRGCRRRTANRSDQRSNVPG